MAKNSANKNFHYSTKEIENYFSVNRISWPQFYLSERQIIKNSGINNNSKVLYIGCACAIYFSRKPIPTREKTKDIPMGKQICIIPFRRVFLLQLNQLTPTPLEIAESVDMMRVLEHGMKVRMVPTEYDTHAVDTLEDLKKVEHLMGKV